MYSKSEAYTRSGEWQLVHCPVLVTESQDPNYEDITFFFIIRLVWKCLFKCPNSRLTDRNFIIWFYLSMIFLDIIESRKQAASRPNALIISRQKWQGSTLFRRSPSEENSGGVTKKRTTLLFWAVYFERNPAFFCLQLY